MRLLHGLAAAGLLLCASAGVSNAADFPNRPITLINPWAPGGPADIHLRALAAQAEKVFKQPVVVENKPGAGGTLGPATMAATAKPDGYTIAELPVGIFAVPAMQKVSFDPAKDFTYIIHLTGYRFVTIVRNDAPWKTWQELAAYGKENPGKLRYASTGTGGALHLGMEEIARGAGFKMTHVPFRGASEQIAALLGGHVEVVPTGGLAFQLIESGQARPLLFWTEKRNAKFPDVPALADVGIKPQVDPNSPYGLGGPKGMDPAVVKILQDGFKQASETPEVMKTLDTIQQDYVYRSSEDYKAYALQQIEAYKKFIDELGLAKH